MLRRGTAPRVVRRGAASPRRVARCVPHGALLAWHSSMAQASGASLCRPGRGSLPLWTSESRVAELVRAWHQGNQAGAHPEKRCDAEDALVAQLWGPTTTRLPRLEASSP